jgi:hypothetical protein
MQIAEANRIDEPSPGRKLRKEIAEGQRNCSPPTNACGAPLNRERMID